MKILKEDKNPKYLYRNHNGILRVKAGKIGYMISPNHVPISQSQYDEFLSDSHNVFCNPYSDTHIDTNLMLDGSDSNTTKVINKWLKVLNDEYKYNKLDIDNHKDLEYCDECGTELDDSGHCPKCDYGEEDL